MFQKRIWIGALLLAWAPIPAYGVSQSEQPVVAGEAVGELLHPSCPRGEPLPAVDSNDLVPVKAIAWIGDRLEIRLDGRIVDSEPLRSPATTDGPKLLQVARPGQSQELKVEVKMLALHSPERLVVDLKGAQLPRAGIPSLLPVSAGAVRQIRVARHTAEGFVRVVLDLSGPAQFRLTRLDPLQIAEVASAVGLATTVATAIPGGARGATEEMTQSRRSKHERVAQAAATPKPCQIAELEPPDEASSVRSPAWPSHQQVIDELVVKRSKGRTLIKMHAKEPLMIWVQQEIEPSRLTIRFPRASLNCPPMVIRTLTKAKTLFRTDQIWELDLDLPAGLHSLAQQVSRDGKTIELGVTRGPRLDPQRAVVLVDPGHGGYDPGTAGQAGHTESAVTLQVAKALASSLAAEGIQAVLTRTIDCELRLQDRVALQAVTGAAAFISLHCNSSSSTDSVGVESYYRQISGRSLAQAIQERVTKATGESDRGVRPGHLYVLRSDRLPATLVEMGFLSNPKEEARLADADYQRKLARAIALGIRDFLVGQPVMSASVRQASPAPGRTLPAQAGRSPGPIRKETRRIAIKFLPKRL